MRNGMGNNMYMQSSIDLLAYFPRGGLKGISDLGGR